ncbi:MAG: porin [Burkholderiales bacterium]|nr:porin [Burkholderiales bacterium]
MKRSLLMLAIFGAFSSIAFAESHVTLYGGVDEGVLVQKNSRSPASVRLQSDMHGRSMWGIMGTEDLGNGNSISFVLEQGFNSNDGTVGAPSYSTDSGFTRQATMALQGEWGMLQAGRVDALSFAPYLMTGWLAFQGVSMMSWETLGASFNRVNNTITYETPVVDGWKVRLMYGNGMGTDTEQWSHNSHYYGGLLSYRGEALRATLTYENVDWKGASFGTDGNYSDIKYRGDQNTINFGIEYDIGIWTPMFAYQWNHKKDGQQSNMFGLATKIRAGGGQVLAGVRYIFGKDTSPAYSKAYGYDTNKLNAWQIDLGYIYPISKRTELKALGIYTNGHKLWHEEPFSSSTMTTQIYNGYQLYAGISHEF